MFSVYNQYHELNPQPGHTEETQVTSGTQYSVQQPRIKEDPLGTSPLCPWDSSGLVFKGIQKSVAKMWGSDKGLFKYMHLKQVEETKPKELWCVLSTTETLSCL